jgi:hypothetical protein
LTSATVLSAVAEFCGKFFVFVQISEISDVTAEDMFEDMFHGRSLTIDVYMSMPAKSKHISKSRLLPSRGIVCRIIQP